MRHRFRLADRLQLKRSKMLRTLHNFTTPCHHLLLTENGVVPGRSKRNNENLKIKTCVVISPQPADLERELGITTTDHRYCRPPPDPPFPPLATTTTGKREDQTIFLCKNSQYLRIEIETLVRSILVIVVDTERERPSTAYGSGGGGWDLRQRSRSMIVVRSSLAYDSGGGGRRLWRHLLCRCRRQW